MFSLLARYLQFYLKQVLQTVLKKIAYVECIVNNVEVVKPND